MFYVLINIVLLIIVAFTVLIERKLLGLSQNRKGPNIVRFYRLLQTIIDRIKLLLKNFLNSPNYFLVFFFLSPFIRLVLVFVLWRFPFLKIILFKQEYRVFFILVLISLNSYVLVWARWRSSNVYSILRAIRAVAQIISYEIVLSFFLFLLLLKVSFFDWKMFHTFSFYFFLSFYFLFFIILLAELNRTPFDLVERESELVRRYNVEFSRSRFTLLFLAEYISIWFMSILFIIFFLKIKVLNLCLVTFLIIYVRAQLPRFKFFDLIKLAWKSLLCLVTLFIVLLLLF